MDEIEKLKKIIQEHEDRIVKLEKLFSDKKSTKLTEKKSTHSGVSGGIQMLIDNGFFGEPKSVKAVVTEMKREGYYDSMATIDSTLRKVFLKNRTLQRINEGKKWKYVIRK